VLQPRQSSPAFKSKSPHQNLRSKILKHYQFPGIMFRT
jgi:hypothetical protein